MSRTGTYHQGATAVIIDGVTLTDLGDEFAYRITIPDSQAVMTVGTQGTATSFSTNKTATLDISLMSVSASNDVIAQIMYTQQRGGGREFPITIFTAESTVETCSRCSIFKGADVEGGGPAMVSRVYTFNVAEYKPNAGDD